MSVEKYKFISPGIFVSEIDNTGRTATPQDAGPAIIGRAEKGPILKPIRVNSFFDFVNIFGEPIPGGRGGDVYRDGNYTSPTYGAYAAQAWFRNNAPVTFVRLGGQAAEDAADSELANAGWKTTDLTPASTAADNGGAFGLFMADTPTRSYPSGTLTINSASITAGSTIILSDDLGTVHTITSGTSTSTTTFDASGGTTAVATAIQNAINLNTIFTASAASNVVTVNVKSTAAPMTDVPSLYQGPLIKESGSADVAATGQLVAVSATPADYDSGLLEIRDTAGTLKTYKFQEGGPATGTESGGNVIIQLSGLGTRELITAQIKAAIEGSTGHNGTIAVTFSTTTHANDTANLTQTVAGALGNRTINRSVITDDSVYTKSGFTGGIDGTAAITLSINGTSVANDVFGRVSASYSATTGTLAAIWYIDQKASIGLSGSRSDTGASGIGAGVYFDSVGDQQFKVQISASGTPSGKLVDSSFDFTRTSDKFLRKVFNTNPILTNDQVVDTNSNSFTRYWLGESFEGAVQDTIKTTSQIGVILPLRNTTVNGSDFKVDYENAETGFFFSQDLALNTASYEATTQPNLFKLVARNGGEYVPRNLKVSINNLRESSDPESDQPYGTFSVLLRKLDDTDSRIQVVEEFNGCNLNPNSPDFIGRKIGTKYVEWSEEEKRYKEYGDYDNRSEYVYVELTNAVKEGLEDARRLPFGVRGPIKFGSFTDATSQTVVNTSLVSGNFSNFSNSAHTNFIEGATATDGLIKYDFPQLRLRVSASEGNPVDQFSSYYGVDTTFNSDRLNKSVKDHLKRPPRGVNPFTAGTSTKVSFDFSLDEICFSTGSTADTKFYAYKSGSRADVSAREGLTYLRGNNSYTEVLDAGIDKFTTVFAGGYDGLDIKESEPLRKLNYITSPIPSRVTNAMFNSVDVAIDSLRDPEVVEYNLAAMPGVVNAALNRKLVDMCESRGDALAIIDVKGGFTPPEQSNDDAITRRGSVEAVVQELKTNPINSSYGAAYYPYVQVQDLSNGQVVTVPPSVPAIGALSYSQKVSELWFAPAGFTRGGLSSGRAGLPVVGVKDRLQSRDRDKLYENRINPIAQFPAEGIVIFGQKTLQVQGSALDRINVRRLMIFLKRQISRFASTILFDQNVRVTWNRFRGQVEPFLRGVQAGLGITDFKLVLDETTTTPDLVDRNILYAKIFIKPARAIEFIAVDFILTDSGAAFED